MSRKQGKTQTRQTNDHQPGHLVVVAGTNGNHLGELMRWLLPNDDIFAEIKFHGNAKWRASDLIVHALSWAMSESKNVTDAFDQTQAFADSVATSRSPSTYQGLMNALEKWTGPLLEALWPVLHQRMREIGRNRWFKVFGFVPIAFDGSRSSAPRTESNEKELCAPNYGKGQTAKYRNKKSKGMRRKRNEKNKAQPQKPQAWITLTWHMGLRLPWMWKLGPSNASERGHVMEMLEEGDFPSETLFCGDAGFVGYPLWSCILKRGYQFLVRVGANVNLLAKTLGCYTEIVDGIVYCWPNEAQRTELPPLRLRLVRVKIGAQKMWMLTSVLSPKRLSRKRIVELYRLRWGIEVEFRGLKQTMDRGELRCRNSKRVLAELNWSIMAMAVAELFALKEQLAPRKRPRPKSNPPPNPKKRSLATTVRAIRTCLVHPTAKPKPGKDLLSRLQIAVTDSYRRRKPKRARYRPPNPDKNPLGNPEIRQMTREEKKKLDAYEKAQNAA